MRRIMLICQNKLFTCLNNTIVAYDGLIKLIQWLITLTVSIVAICIGGKRLKDLFAFYKQQKFGAAFGYHTILRHYCQQLRVLVDLGTEFWTDITNDNPIDGGFPNNYGSPDDEFTEGYDSRFSDEMENYQKMIASFSRDFLKFLCSEKGQIPIVTNEQPFTTSNQTHSTYEQPDTISFDKNPQSLAQQSKDEQCLSAWSKNLSRLFNILLDISIINDYNVIPDREKIKKELIVLTDFFESLTIKEIETAQKDYNQTI